MGTYPTEGQFTRHNASRRVARKGDRRLPVLLRRAWFGLNQAFRRRCARLGLTPDQYTALRTLLEAEGRCLTQKQLVEAMCSDANTVASLLKRMEANQWIERQTDDADRRARRVIVLPDGRRQYAKARREALSLQAQVLEALPDETREDFLKQLECVAEACRESKSHLVQANQGREDNH